MTVELDVTPEVLQGRNLFLAAGGKIKCSKRLLGVLQTMSVAGGKYEILL
ncbi:unknown [Clostridium sp. CAG:678]|nr:unknown [Clostridium sp. CAG:678]